MQGLGYLRDLMVLAGHPVDFLRADDGQVVPFWLAEATQEQIAAGQAWLAAQDLDTLGARAIKAQAKAAAVSTTSPTSVAARNGLRLSNLAEVESRLRLTQVIATLNALAEWANAQGASVPLVDDSPLVVFGQQAALAVTEQLIDLETDPTSD